MLGHAAWLAFRDRFDCWVTLRRSLGETIGAHLFRPEKTVESVDATRIATVAAALDAVRPDVVVNAVGLVKQAPDATDAPLGIQLNALFPHQLARCCAERSAVLVHLSTDCVFSGRRGMYREDDPADADDLYGRSKRLGEPIGPNIVTLRTSFIGFELASARGLLEWCLSQRGGRVTGFRRARFNGLSTPVLAGMMARLIESGSLAAGTYHVGGEPIDKYSLLVLIRDAFDLDLEIVPADVPVVDRTLDSSRFHAATRLAVPAWPSMVAGLAAIRRGARENDDGRAGM